MPEHWLLAYPVVWAGAPVHMGVDHPGLCPLFDDAEAQANGDGFGAARHVEAFVDPS